MAYPVIMPRQGQSVESCILAKWHKKPGDSVVPGDLLFSYETDKAGFDEESKNSGIFLVAFFEEGDDVPCLTNVCVIGEAGEDFAAYKPGASAAASEIAPIVQDKADIQEKKEAAAPAMLPVENAFVSPRAKNLAERAGIDYRVAAATGPAGRIIERDILALRDSGAGLITSAARAAGMTAGDGTGLGGRVTMSAAAIAFSAPTAPAVSVSAAAVSVPASGDAMYDEVKIPNIRKVIAKAMHNSLASTAQLTLNGSFDATSIMNFRKKLKDSKERLGLENITLNDIVLFAVSRTLPSHKDLNANFNGESMLYFRHVNLGVAIDTPRGLMVPTLFNAETKSLNQISKEVKELAKACQSGSINPDLLKNGSFTVTNLGTFGIESFTPVLNPPQTGILGVNNITQRVREAADGNMEMYPAMGLSITFDHRAIDGAPTARFLQELCRNLESFETLLTK